MGSVKPAGVALFLALAACAGASKQAKTANGTAVAKDEEKFHCQMERVTGSNIPERVCRLVDDNADLARQRVQDAVRESQHSVQERGSTP